MAFKEGRDIASLEEKEEGARKLRKKKNKGAWKLVAES
jgi:hypothetical protein